MMIEYTLLAGAANQSQFLGDLFHLDALSLHWTSLSAGLTKGSPPTARYGHGMATIHGSIYIFGGLGASGEAIGLGLPRKIGKLMWFCKVICFLS